jgi:hypothetical protein
MIFVGNGYVSALSLPESVLTLNDMWMGLKFQLKWFSQPPKWLCYWVMKCKKKSFAKIYPDVWAMRIIENKQKVTGVY